MSETTTCPHCGKKLSGSPKSLSSHMGYWHKDLFVKEEKSKSIVCRECGEAVANSPNVLGRHLRTVHHIDYPDYLVKHEHNGIWPVCECGCGQRVEWHKGGFSRYATISCASKGEHNGMYGLTGEKSPNFGKVRTQEQRANYSVGAHKRWAVHS